jgi:hypothetical protein
MMTRNLIESIVPIKFITEGRIKANLMECANDRASISEFLFFLGAKIARHQKRLDVP